jgi:hypothetical protein
MEKWCLGSGMTPPSPFANINQEVEGGIRHEVIELIIENFR